jgi:hypothetical protein
MSWGTWVFAMEFRHYIGCVDVVVWYPAIVSCVISLPLHQILHSAVAYATIEDFFDFELFLSIYQYWGGWSDGLAT